MTDARIREYIREINQNLAFGKATEHTHRSALKRFLEDAFPNIEAVNEPRRIECGAPDLQIAQRGDAQLTIGYIETKDIGADISGIDRDSGYRYPKTNNGKQLKRYREALPNLILTNYLNFIWYVNGEKRLDASLARLDADNNKVTKDRNGAGMASSLLNSFMNSSPESVGSPEELAKRMAGLAQMIRDSIDENDLPPALRDLHEASEKTLDPNLAPSEFIDMFAQTLSYGLFAARVNHDGSGPFTRHAAAHEIPSANPFTQKMLHFIVGPELDDEPYAFLVDDLTQLLANADMHAVLADFGSDTGLQDPIMHFYTTFLNAYDRKQRKEKGAYYTPDPVIGYIVRSVDCLLKSKFNCPNGLADRSKAAYAVQDEDGNEAEKKAHRVLILDPACGTGSFLYAVVERIRAHFESGKNAGMWSKYVREHLLPRLYGFELLMAPYVIAHLRLWMQLSGMDMSEQQRAIWNYKFSKNDRLRVHLTNSLDQTGKQQPLPGPFRALTDEANAADEIKNHLPVMVVLGNPPYLGESKNKSEWITKLIDDYKQIDGDPIREKAIKWISNDYVKFIRFGQWRIERSGSGILAFITDHGFMYNPTFRGMRKSLLNAFDEIYLLDLHGAVNTEGSAPDGGKNENVFDIKQGVAISLFVKNPRETSEKKKLADAYHADIWGSREQKYERLNETDIETTEWTRLDPKSPYYFLRPFDDRLQDEWMRWPKINELMPVNSAGITTARDPLTIHFTEYDLMRTVLEFAQLEPEEARSRFQLRRDTRDWKVALAQKDLNDSDISSDNMISILYRPFDMRYTYYTGKSRGFMTNPRPTVMRHMTAGSNIGLSTIRAISTLSEFDHIFVARNIVENHAIATPESNYLYPLYLYGGNDGQAQLLSASRRPNLDETFIQNLEASLGLRFLNDGQGDLEAAFGPEDVFRYIYAVFHSPTYRKRYDPFLRADFPRVPHIQDARLFRRLVHFGGELVSAHLLESPAESTLRFPVQGESVVEPRHPRYEPPKEHSEGRVYINASTVQDDAQDQYFEGVSPEVWEFQIGGYHPMEKWLKDRQGRPLSYDDIEHYQQMAAAVSETIRLMPRIDEAIAESGDLFPVPG